MHIIGLTGGIASGKSLVSNFIHDHYQCFIIDADQLAREAVKKDSSGLEKIVQTFGKSMILPDGNLNRKRLGQIIAQDEEAKKKLEAIVHPEVKRLYEEQVENQKKLKTELVIYDCPLLFEAHLQDDVDEIYLLVADETIRRSRIIKRNNISEDLATKKIKMQLKDELKMAQADLIIVNNGTIDDLVKTLDCYLTKDEKFVKR